MAWLVRWLHFSPMIDHCSKSENPSQHYQNNFQSFHWQVFSNAYFLCTALERNVPTDPPTTTPPPPVSCGVKATNRPVSEFSIGEIIGGKISTPGAWPWQVAIMCRTCKSQDCGGTLVSAYHVVTAAHCVPSDIDSFIKDYKVGIVLRHWLRMHVATPMLVRLRVPSVKHCRWTVRYPRLIIEKILKYIAHFCQ